MSWIKIPYGNYYQEAELPDDLNVEIIDPPQQKIETDVVACIEDALDHPVGSLKLEDMVASGQNIVILVNDQTRPGPNAEMVKGIRARLKRKEIADENITIVIATGSHKGPDSKQLHKLLGGLEEKLKVHVHDCEDGEHIFRPCCSGGRFYHYYRIDLATSVCWLFGRAKEHCSRSGQPRNFKNPSFFESPAL